MLVIPGQYGKDTCDGYSRRELLRVGGSALFGLSLPSMLKATTAQAAPRSTTTSSVPRWACNG